MMSDGADSAPVGDTKCGAPELVQTQEKQRIATGPVIHQMMQDEITE